MCAGSAVHPEGNSMFKWLLIACVVGVALLLWRITAHANRNLPKVGDAAPDFRLPDQHGTLRASDEFRGKWLVLYFYPRDDTPGCTEQACKFRDDFFALTQLGAQIVGVSLDDSASHAEFARKYSLPFPLLADKNGVVTKSYGALPEGSRYADRYTFLISPEGKVAKIY